MSNADMPAMPILSIIKTRNGVMDEWNNNEGLTKREHMEIEFAKALIMSPNYGYNIAKHVADDARKQTDAMIAMWESEK